MDKNYRELFFGESQEYLREINSALVRLEQDNSDMDAINLVFRLTHTIKGMAATMGFTELAEFAHRLEDAFDAFRSGRSNLSPESMDTVFESIDVFTTIINDLKEEKAISLDIFFYLNKLESIIPREKADEKKKTVSKEDIKIDGEYIKKFQDAGKNVFRVEIRLAQDCPMKGVRAFLVLSRLKEIGEIVKVMPSEDGLRDEDFELSFELVIATLKKEEDIRNQAMKILEVDNVTVAGMDTATLGKIEKKEKVATGYIKKINSIRIPTERLDKIMNLMGELSIAKSRLLQTVQVKDYKSLDETIYILDRLVVSLQDEALKLRLLPISYLLDNFPRIVRDLARKENKDVELKIEGSEIELDRVILDEIGDSLIHILRNSVDHGIEFPDEREKAKKNRKGTILIRVSRDKGHIIIEITDDGKGVDIKAVVDRGLAAGIISHEEAAHHDVHTALDVLTTPGFSTKDVITDISGRGVGLDVVQNKMDTLGGRLDMETDTGKGTKFILTLPLTLAIIKAMLTGVGKYVYAIPLMNIRETVKIHNQDIKLIKDIEVMQLRGEVIPLIRLAQELGLEEVVSADNQSDKDELLVVIVEGRIKSMGLVVNKILGEQDVVVKPLSSYIKKIKGITGATILGDGSVALILDVVNLR